MSEQEPRLELHWRSWVIGVSAYPREPVYLHLGPLSIRLTSVPR